MYVWYLEQLLATSLALLMSSNPPSNTQNCRCCKQRRQSSSPSAVSQSQPWVEPAVTAPNTAPGLMGHKKMKIKTDSRNQLFKTLFKMGVFGFLWGPETSYPRYNKNYLCTWKVDQRLWFMYVEHWSVYVRLVSGFYWFYMKNYQRNDEKFTNVLCEIFRLLWQIKNL